MVPKVRVLYTKKMDKHFFWGYSDTQQFDISIIKAIELGKKTTLKNNKLQDTECAWTQPVEDNTWICCYYESKNQVYLLTLSCIPMTHYFKAL